jgi:hypothetical protein
MPDKQLMNEKQKITLNALLGLKAVVIIKKIQQDSNRLLFTH